MERINKQNLRSWYPIVVAVSVVAFIGAVLGFRFAAWLGDHYAVYILPAFIQESNLVKYIFSLVIFAVAFVFIYALSCVGRNKKAKIIPSDELSERKYNKWLILGCLVIAMLLLLRRFVFELNDKGANIQSMTFHRLPIGVALLVIILWNVAVTGYSRSGKDISKGWVYCGYALLISLTYVSSLTLDYFHADIHHGVAYVESVYNVYHMIPYTLETTGIYGRHGLFYAPLLHLLGGSNVALMYLIAGVQTIAVALCIYSIHNITKQNFFRLLCAFASCMVILAMRSSNYWQLQPHRVIFSVIIIAYTVYLVKHNCWSRKNIFVGYLLCLLACLWNTECGLFCCVAFTLAVIVNMLQYERWYSPRMLLTYLKCIICFAGAVLGAIGIVVLYNHFCGHHGDILRVFFFPLLEDTYMNELLMMHFQLNPDAWLFVLVFFAVMLLLGLLNTTLFYEKEELQEKPAAQYAPLAVVVAALGLCNYSYYANRAAYMNLEIVFQIACVGNSVLWQMFHTEWVKGNGKGYTYRRLAASLICATCVFVVSTLALQTVLFTVPIMQEKVQSGHYDLTDYNHAKDQLQDNIPENTFAFGGGIAGIYSALDWDTVGHYRDFSDLQIDGDGMVDVIAEDTIEQDAFVVFHSSDQEAIVLNRILELEPGFILEKELELYGRPLQYFVLKNGS